MWLYAMRYEGVKRGLGLIRLYASAIWGVAGLDPHYAIANRVVGGA